VHTHVYISDHLPIMAYTAAKQSWQIQPWETDQWQTCVEVDVLTAIGSLIGHSRKVVNVCSGRRS